MNKIEIYRINTGRDQAMSDQKSGLFIISLASEGTPPGSPHLHLNLAVYTPEKRITGWGELTQPVSPPLHRSFEVSGHYVYLTVIPVENSHILLKLIGYEVVPPLELATRKVVLVGDVVLSNDWHAGIAHISYLDNAGEWRKVDLKVAKVAPPAAQ